ncbi:hypothetical protein [Heliophilum fasciatum]|uniref:Uncharacterized protein n=1 Tax=Heliophilum fasciatum TaxID=35700 RepID=A0A4R2RTH2_9FIRM|nr:hypothetical protein [Heliophilum fasciatum]MCW2278764.1 hypothetical protein [Heliophilum fasciatum]TCP62435.1 hypothetical protein EDD73_1225 [Heliophilum fasciatum]
MRSQLFGWQKPEVHDLIERVTADCLDQWQEAQDEWADLQAELQELQRTLAELRSVSSTPYGSLGLLNEAQSIAKHTAQELEQAAEAAARTWREAAQKRVRELEAEAAAIEKETAEWSLAFAQVLQEALALPLEPKPKPVPSPALSKPSVTAVPVIELAPEPRSLPMLDWTPETKPVPMLDWTPGTDLVPELKPEPETNLVPELEPEPEINLVPELEPEPETNLVPELEPEPKTNLVPELEPELKTSLVPELEPEPKTNLVPELEPEPKTSLVPELDWLSEKERIPLIDWVTDDSFLPAPFSRWTEEVSATAPALPDKTTAPEPEADASPVKGPSASEPLVGMRLNLDALLAVDDEPTSLSPVDDVPTSLLPVNDEPASLLPKDDEPISLLEFPPSPPVAAAEPSTFELLPSRFLAPEPEPAPEPAPEEPLPSSLAEQQMRYILGNRAGADLLDEQGRILISKGDLITKDVFHQVHKANRLVELIIDMIPAHLNPR